MAATDFLRDLINEHFYKNDVFSLTKAYELFIPPFEEKYPLNSYIEAKIRQQIQALREQSFIEFVDYNGCYRITGNSARVRPPEHTIRPEYMSAEELDDAEVLLVEGAHSRISINAFERNKKARDACIAHHGYHCSVCDFDFEQCYGAYGIGYIQVHHIVPLSTVTEQYVVDPISDLTPVCGNCHAIIHRKIPAYTIDEVKKQIASNRNHSEQRR